MDALKHNVLTALECVINESEDCLCRITQNLADETLTIENNLGQKTVVNCIWNSIGATIRQLCMHINKRDLFSYEDGYIIGG